MTMAAYMVHECAHGSILTFKLDSPFYALSRRFHKRSHAVLGSVMLWICGAAYTPYHVIRYCHLRHHSTTADVTSWDFHSLLEHPSRPAKLLRTVTVAAEWAYVPLVEWMVRPTCCFSPI